MVIEQLSVFLENKEGRLCAAIDELTKNNVNISALSLADTAEFGILRLIVDMPEKAKEVLEHSGVAVRLTDVIAVAMDDVPGGMSEILHILKDASLNIEYMYACVGLVSGKALTVMRLSDSKKGEEVLRAAGYGKIKPEEIYRI
jgi:hypothetical protein